MKRVFRILFILLLVLGWVIKEFVSDVPIDEISEDSPSCSEYAETDSLQSSTTHHRSWHEYTWNDNYCTSYMIRSAQVSLAEQFRVQLTVDESLSDNEFWRAVYLSLYQDTGDHLRLLQDSLASIGMEGQLDRGDLARMVVALVQDIPYQYILPDGCEGEDSAPCQPNVRFGIYSPLEFLYTMKGDCDTRTVLLYTLLKNMGYDPLIINSDEYRHSMLALDVPASGDDFVYNGRRYAYWETTNTGWLPGMLPPSMNNKDYWTVALDYEYKNQPVGNY